MVAGNTGPIDAVHDPASLRISFASATRYDAAMAVIRKFYSLDLGAGENDSFALARDAITDQVFVVREETRRSGSNHECREYRLSVAEFLAQDGPPQEELLDLIGTLIVKDAKVRASG